MHTIGPLTRPFLVGAVMTRTIQDRVLDIFRLSGKPLVTEELLDEVNNPSLTEEGEEILSFKQVLNSRSKLVKSGYVAAIDSGGKRNKAFRYVKDVVDEEDQLWKTAREHDKRKEENTKKIKQLEKDSKVMVLDIDKMEQIIEDFKEMMSSLIEIAKYAKEIETSMKFWMNEAKSAGIRWGCTAINCKEESK